MLLKWLLYGSIFIFPWIHLPGLGNLNSSQFFGMVWLGTVLLGVLIWATLTHAVRIPRGKLWYLLAFFAVSQGLSALFSLSHSFSIWGAYQNHTDGLIFNLVLLLFFYGILTLELELHEAIELVYLFLIQAFFLSAATLGEGIGWGFPFKVASPISPLLNIDYFLSYALLALPLAITSCLLWYRKQGSRLVLVLHGLGVMVISLALFVALPPAIQGVPYAIIHKLYDHPTKTVATVAPSASLVTPQNFLTNDSNTERFTQWKLGLAIGKKYPLLGEGQGTIQEGFFQVENSVDMSHWSYNSNLVMVRPHNSLIEVFATTGIVGVLASLILWVGYFGWALRIFKDLTTSQKLLIIGITGGLILYLTFNLLLFTTLTAGTMSVVLVALALSIAGKGEYIFLKANRTLVGIVSGAVFIIFLWASYGTWHYYQAEREMELVRRSDAPSQVLDRFQEAGNAATLFSLNPYYSWQAATLGGGLVTNPPKGFELSPASTSDLLSTVEYFAHTATTEDPYTTFYRAEEGAALYELAPHGSPKEQQGEQLMQQAISESPHYADLYLSAADAYTFKGQCSLAKEVIERVIQLPLDPMKKNRLTAHLKEQSC